MCGLVGVLGAYTNGFTNKEQALFRDLLVVDTVRGYDGTGVFAVTNTGDVDVLKAARVGGDFVAQKEYTEFNSTLNIEGIFAVGHNRWATKGSVKDENCHPFIVNDEIVLVQNGTMYGSHNHIADVDVDSHALAHLLQRETDITKALNSINAAYALIWYDARTTTLNFIRNEERPLWFCKTKEDTVIFASEPWMLTAMAARQEMEIKEKPWQLKEDVLLQYKLNVTDHTYTCAYETLKIQAPSPVSYGYSAYPTSKSQHAANDTSSLNLPMPQYVKTKESLYIPTSEAIGKNNPDKGWSEAKAKEYADDFRVWHGTFRSIEKPSKAVEVYDVCPGNNHADCTTWHVLALELQPNYHNDFRIWYHWIVYNQSKAQIAQYIKDGLFNVECCPVYTTTYDDGKKSYFYNISYCTNPQPVVMQ